MSVAYYLGQEVETEQLNETTNLKIIHYYKDNEQWEEWYLEKEVERVLLSINLGQGLQRIHINQAIVLYYMEGDNLEIKEVVDLYTLEEMNLTKSQELAWFKLCCEMQSPPLEFEVETKDQPIRRKVFYDNSF